ncbi:acyl-CoA dehydrogenase [Flavobacterium sp. Fl-77]|uniref:acyl-CoA oxidase n=1 Tax=Flavobacterium flavipigmentatum TaxID=2893884 RepID=A0AAJ2S9L2_9FLAO|nr:MULTISPECIES: acyl-CoA dehydrogenase [unclassified Flavobacterium]MDX6183606.1 acyl-CoA dehydrogenase [Flavobacterium sp. Fl-33]MDX6187158.1 acyl-CoA dehydrogenase [Flavobacterium sp. Fl-77]UFH38031.1 acyl-CoA dehydrogenase family protein [Flavobacterium sp. F-70]
MKNTKLQAFTPLFYLLWSDDLLTQKEFTTLKEFIISKTGISPEDQEYLFSKIDISNPPSRNELSQWKADITKTIQNKPSIKNIFELAGALSEKDSDIYVSESDFLKLENDLGILGEEVIQNFKSKADSFTASSQTTNNFDIQKITKILDGEQAEIIKKVKTVISRPEFAYETSADVAVYRETVYDWCKILAKENLGNMAYPKRYGGGENIADYFAIMETLSYHDLSLVIKFGVQFGLWGMSVQSLGTEKHYAKYLNDIGTLKLPGCFAMTETHHGSNVKGLETTATYNHKDQTFTIHTPHEKAQKEYIGNAAVHGQMATVFAKLIVDDHDYGVNAFIVPLRDAEGNTLSGITIGDCGHKMGLNGVDNGTISFDKVIIPKENMLDRFASVNDKGEFESPIPSDNRRFFTMLGTLVGGRIGIPRSALAAAKSGLTITIRYSDLRRQFGPEGGSEVPILNYRMHQRRLLPHLAKTYAVHFALQYLTKRFLNKTEDEMQEIEALAAGMKSYSTWSTRDILQECREAIGGKGYLSENRIDALKNDTEIYTTFEGDNTVLMQLVAKNRLSEFRKSFGEMGSLGIINYVYENAKTAIAEKNPIATRRTDDEHLLDDQFHIQAFIHREKTILASAARRIKKLVDSGLEPYDAFNVVQHQMIDVAEAYLERVVLEQFQAAIQAIEDVKIKEILTKLNQLYALAQIEKNKAWYLEDGYMEAVKTKAIRKMVNQLCWDIRPDAVALVNAFDIPESCLAAPIAV